MDQLLTLSDDDDTNFWIELYDRYYQFLRSCPVHSLPVYVLRDVTVMIHSTLYHDSDWRGFASRMGITENLHLAKIQESAKAANDQPLYIALTRGLPRINGSIANIIKALIDEKRFDVLSYLKPYIQDLLKKIPSTEVKGFVTANEHLPPIQNKNSDLSSETSDLVLSSNSNGGEKLEKVGIIELDPALFTKYTEHESDAFQKNCDSKNPIQKLKLNPFPDMNKPLCEEGLLQQLKLLPSVPFKERLTVLIQHTEHHIGTARELSVKMTEKEITVITLSDIENLVPMDFEGALRIILQEVDFIVPIVSEEFLQQIYEKNLDSNDANINRALYSLFMTEIRSIGENVRVRPVLTPKMNRCSLRKDVFFYSFRLWTELDKLVRVLKETKPLIAQYRTY